MKKFLLSFLAIIMCIPALAFAGCSESSDSIKMTTYFETKVNYQVYGRTGTNESTLSDYIGSKTDNMDQYMSITFNGKPDWLYKMTVEYVTFEVYSNQTEEIEMNIKISNLKNGDQSNVGGSSVFTKQIAINLKANESVKVKVPVNDYFESNSATTTIKLEITDTSYFYSNKANTGLKFTVQNFGLIANHK